jgi:RNA polymerase sigma-70 factor (ECF subfamily)
VEAMPGPDSPERNSERLDDINRLEAALNELSEEHRIVVLLHDSEGYKLKEIQEITGDPIGTLKSRLHRARARLREMLSAGGTF